MKKIMIFLLSCLMFSLPSCSSALKHKDVDSWLISNAGSEKAMINITGAWEDIYKDEKSFHQLHPWAGYTGWEQGTFEQIGREVTGTLGNYMIKGIVSGDTLVMVLMYGGTPYYMAKLKMRNNKLSGEYYYSKDKELESPFPMTLKKVESK